MSGEWYPDRPTGTRLAGESIGEYNTRLVHERLAAGASHEDAYRDLEDTLPETADEAMRRTHHEEGSAEERYSRQMRFDKYVDMQQLLGELANAAPDDNHAMQFQPRARAILAGMVRPRGPAVRATDRADEIEVLLYAYRVPARVLDAEGPIARRAATLTIEALKAWERAHPPAPLDPLLL